MKTTITMNPKEHQVYKRVLKNIQNGNFIDYKQLPSLCVMIAVEDCIEHNRQSTLSFSELEKHYPMFYSYKPKNKMESGYWWSEDDWKIRKAILRNCIRRTHPIFKLFFQ